MLDLGLGRQRSLFKRPAEEPAPGAFPKRRREAPVKAAPKAAAKKEPASLNLRQGETFARGKQRAQRELVENALGFLEHVEDEATDDSRAAAAAHLEALDGLAHPKLELRPPDDLKQWNVLLALQEHEKFPAAMRTPELEGLINELKKEVPEKQAMKKLMAHQNELMAKLLPKENLEGLLKALLRVLQTANPKAADIKDALECVGPSLRCLLALPRPEHFRAQKRASWLRDSSVLLALAVAGYRAQVAHHLQEEPAEEGSADFVVSPAGEELEEEVVDSDEILAAMT